MWHERMEEAIPCQTVWYGSDSLLSEVKSELHYYRKVRPTLVFFKLQTSGNIPLRSVGHQLFIPRANLGPCSPLGCMLFVGITDMGSQPPSMTVQALSEWTTKWVANK